ncbi:Scr1 family TA system antitoxin-like transcriptional regulator [Nocardia callitridis]
MYIEKPELVQRYHEYTDALRRTALDETSTRDLLRQVAREHDRD